jgi:hypothetical protein
MMQKVMKSKLDMRGGKHNDGHLTPDNLEPGASADLKLTPALTLPLPFRIIPPQRWFTVPLESYSSMWVSHDRRPRILPMKQQDNHEPKNGSKTFHPHHRLFTGIVPHE